MDRDTVLCENDIVPSSDVLPTLMRELGKSSNESALAARSDNSLNGRQLTCLAVLVPPLATPTRLVEGHNIGRPKFFRSRLLR